MNAVHEVSRGAEAARKSRKRGRCRLCRVQRCSDTVHGVSRAADAGLPKRCTDKCARSMPSRHYRLSCMSPSLLCLSAASTSLYRAG
eukprot:397694-Pelagomonas_calceolata.AAC.3